MACHVSFEVDTGTSSKFVNMTYSFDQGPINFHRVPCIATGLGRLFYLFRVLWVHLLLG